MPKLIIDEIPIEVEDGLTVMQACQIAGKEIPHFCFHKRLNIAGNCRMCLVEVEKAPKPVASCALPVAEGMIVHTNTAKVQKAREGVMEFLLINHPLDCPICDQGGECDLQDQAFKYGKGSNRFHENKRSVKDKYIGPLIKTHMTRCIQCTRCIRFATEVAGVEEIGAIYRGEHMEVTSYLERSLTSELSGNMIDICPVGALTSKPYAFKARSWELTSTESIDIHDAVGSNIRIDAKGLEVMRILPKLNEDINEEWLGDKSRFSYDGLKNQRIDQPYIKKDGKLVACSWQEALSVASEKIKQLKGEEIASIAGTLVSCEAMFALKKLLSSVGSNNIDANQFNYKIDTLARGNYLFNTSIAGIEQADLCLLVGASPRQNAPILNARIGKMQRAGALKIARIGEADDQTYEIYELGSDLSLLEDILSDKHPFATELKNAKKPMIIIGDAVLLRKDSSAILDVIHQIVEKYHIMRAGWQGFNILHNHASMVGSLDVGFYPQNGSLKAAEIVEQTKAGKIKLLYLLGADEIKIEKAEDFFVIYQGHHGDVGVNYADLILPAPAYTEQDGIYVNIEGRAQKARKAVQPPRQAREDWQIIVDLANELGINLGFNNLNQIRLSLAEYAVVFANIDEIIENPFVKFISKDKKINEAPLTKVPVNYYMTDAISRASVTMARCIKAQNSVIELGYDQPLEAR